MPALAPHPAHRAFGGAAGRGSVAGEDGGAAEEVRRGGEEAGAEREGAEGAERGAGRAAAGDQGEGRHHPTGAGGGRQVCAPRRSGVCGAKKKEAQTTPGSKIPTPSWKGPAAEFG